jgi:hypothetical protein
MRENDLAEEIDFIAAMAVIPEQRNGLHWTGSARLTERVHAWSILTGEICHDGTNAPVLHGGSSSLAPRL